MKLLFGFATLCYFISFIYSIIFFKTFNKKYYTISNRSLIIGFVIHLIYFIFRWFKAGYFPVTTLFESLSFFALVIVFFQFLIDFKYKVKGISIFSIFFATLLMLISLLFPFKIVEIPPILDSFWLPLHVFFAFLGNGIFAISCGISIMYLIQLKSIKSKKLSRSFFEMPSLETLDSLNYKCLTIGFPLLTIGIITGSIWASSAWGSYWSWDPKEVWSLITWLLYAALLHGRLNIGWRGKKAAIMSIIGFLVIVFTFLGVNILLPGLHSYAARV